MSSNNDPKLSTCWTMILDAAQGGRGSIEQFTKTYEPVVRAYLLARWRYCPWRDELPDVVQEVFVECLRPGGVLEKVDAGRSGGFRAYLYGVVRNVAMRYESRRSPKQLTHEPADSESSLGKSFDREYARTIMREASRLMAEWANENGPEAERRLELLRLRFQENRPIRDIAGLWGLDAAKLHHDYATARQEFRLALHTIVKFHNPAATDAGITAKCRELLDCLK